MARTTADIDFLTIHKVVAISPLNRFFPVDSLFVMRNNGEATWMSTLSTINISSLHILGSLDISGNLDVSGNVTVDGNVDISGDVTIGEDGQCNTLNLYGDMNIINCDDVHVDEYNV